MSTPQQNTNDPGHDDWAWRNFATQGWDDAASTAAGVESGTSNGAGMTRR